MKRLLSIEEINEVISVDDAILFYITSKNCNVCKALKPKIEKLFLKNFPKISLYEIDIEKIPGIGSKFNIYTIPVILLFFDKKEFLRESRNVNLYSLKERVEKIYNLYFGQEKC
ncbi:MAG TPA: thioredoxin [Campylobacterales bacterium]|nr:thioredoxin [Campylobacterales bacterium]